MGQDPDQIRREIERTRSDMGASLDEIGERVSPGRIVERRKEGLRQGWQSVRTRVMGSDAEESYPTYPPYGGAYGGAYEEGSSTSGLSSTVSNLKEGVQGAPEQMRRQAQGNPLVAGAIAFGAGLLAASLMPSSKVEQKAAAALNERAEPLKQQAKEAASEMGANVADAAKEAQAQLAEQAKESADLVKGEAQSAAGDLSEEAKSSAEDVRQQAQSAAGEVKEDAQSSAQSVKDSAGS